MGNSSGFQEFCGGPEFFDADKIWNSTSPRMSDCFMHTVLVWIPVAFLFLLSPLQIYLMYASKRLALPWTWFLGLKLAVYSLTVADVTVAFVYTVMGHSNRVAGISQADFVAWLLRLIALMTLVGYVFACRLKGLVTSAIIFITLVLFAILNIPEFIMRIEDFTNGDIDTKNAYILAPVVCYFIYFVLTLVLLVLHCFADMPDDYKVVGKQKQCPEADQSFFSRITFSWLNGICMLGWRRSLTNDDMWHLNDKDTSRTLVQKWESVWTNRVHQYWTRRDAAARHQHATQSSMDESNRSAKQSMLSKNGADALPRIDVRRSTSRVSASGGDATPPPLPSVVQCLFLCLKWEFLKGTVTREIADVLQFVNPMVLSLLLTFIATPSEPLWKGYFYAVIMFGATLLQSMFTHNYYHSVMRMGMNIRTILVSAIFKKSLNLANMARRRYTAGEIVNHMAVDVQRYMDVMQYVNYMWSAPITICLSMYFLYNQLGPSVFAGLGVMLLLVPFNLWVSVKQRQLNFTQMKLKDNRIKMVNEILNGIKVLKFYAWEESFEKQVLDIRAKELNVLRSNAYYAACTMFTWTCAPVMVAVVTFACYVLVDPAVNILTPQKAFVSLSLFNIMKIPLTLLPMLVSFMVQATVSNRRVKEFLVAEELDTNTVDKNADQAEMVKVDNASFTWDKESEMINLENINMRVMPGQLVAVVGQVGSGKSSLISAILGEMDRVSGYVGSKGKIAYVPQQAWIQNLTLRDNILFAKPYDEANYDRIIEACALKTDLEILPGGDSTEIGEKGINVSGGQKQRISLARAVYQNADLYLLDDPLSAVDAHVGRHIFNKVISNDGVLRGKTRILVTHGLGYLQNVDKIFVLRDGKISETGTYKELLSRRGAFADLIENYLEQKVKEAEDDISVLEEVLGDGADPETLERIGSVISRRNSMDTSASGMSGPAGGLLRLLSHYSATVGAEHANAVGGGTGGGVSDTAIIEAVRRASSIHSANKESFRAAQSLKKRKKSGKKEEEKEIAVVVDKDQEKKNQSRLIEVEQSEMGQVKWGVYKDYCAAVGYWTVLAIFVLYAASNAFVVGSSIWLSDWSDDSLVPLADRPDPNLRVWVYAVLGIAQALFTLAGGLLMAFGMVQAGGHMHQILLRNLLRSPMSFYDVTPMGRIMNRIGKDVDIIDNTLQQNFRTWLLTVMGVGATLIVIMIGLPIFAAVIVPLGLLYYFVQRFYISTSRQLKRLESISRSPIYSHFQETISGSMVIRAYDVGKRFADESEFRVDFNNESYYPNVASNRWLGIRLDLVGNMLVVAAAICAVITKGLGGTGAASTAGMIGVAVSYAMSITLSLNITVRMASEVESNVVSVERIKEYSETPTEAEWLTDVRPPQGWPQTGQVDFGNYQLRYRPGLDLVLKGISCQVTGGEKIGIVGRTGAGKSSLTLALFRMVEAAGGSITIDGQDISRMGLHDLRGRLTIIPQEPVLFSGNLRVNLDPFESYSDEQIWVALEQSHLKDFVAQTTSKLMYPIAEGGENLSVGQRQLICLARALLRKTKVLILDEATAAVDLETDDLIQKTIRTHFADCTILTIAHRLNTILDSDRVMVLSAGDIVEFDNPSRLLGDSSTVFYGMAKDAGIV